MIFTTFYFSGTGNTKWAVYQLEKAITSAGHKSVVRSVEEEMSDLRGDVEKSDFIGIAFPVYCMNVPEIIKRFLENLKLTLPDAPKSLFVVTTVGYKDGCGPYEVVKRLGGRSKLKGYTSLKMANNISVPGSKNAPLAPNELNRRLKAARKKIDRLVRALIYGQIKVDMGVYPLFFFRGKLNRIVLNAYKHISVDPVSCGRCMICVAQCPTKSIVAREDGFCILPTCTACMRCYNDCPTFSIWYNDRYADPNEFIRYKGPKTTARPE
jgi:NAD-dependent dihydropyrimidine dehydrogenase PreA subunit